MIMGIHLMDNFNAPYYAKNVKEFWQRWHISLSGWFRDYLYIPLGGNRKGKLRKECNLLAVFAVSGLWHGASSAFILWGILNGIYQIIGDIKVVIIKNIERIRERWQQFTEVQEDYAEIRFSTKIFQTIFTFMLITFAWLFFRAGGAKAAIEIIKHMVSVNNWIIFFDGSLYELGVARNYMNVLFISIILLFFIDFHKYHGKDVTDIFLRQGWCFRVMCIMLLIFTILLYGCYGELYDTQQFIYFQF